LPGKCPLNYRILHFMPNKAQVNVIDERNREKLGNALGLFGTFLT